MAKIILKSPYMKPISSKHIKTYVKYIATRDGVVAADDTSKYLSATSEQQKLIKSLLKDFPDTKNSYEYQDYLKNPNRENATDLISYAIENNLVDRARYVKYISERPGVEKLSSHGLFTDDGIAVSVSKVQEDIEKSKSNVWTHIISLRREDAERLGYNSVKAWQNLISSHRDEIAKQMHIKPNDFRWYAAFHNESHHPHVHMIAYAAHANSGYLNADGIKNIKSILAKDIFRDDSLHLYAEKDIQRENIKSLSSEIAQTLVKNINDNIFDNPQIEEKLVELAKRLENTPGKKVYGYLKPDVKRLIDSIVDELAKDEKISSIYDLWYEKKFETIRIYTDELPEKIPLSQNKEFKSIKNIIITAALDINADNIISDEGERFTEALDETDSDIPFEHDYSTKQRHSKKEQYLSAKRQLDETDSKYNPEEAIKTLEDLANQGYASAEYLLGNLNYKYKNIQNAEYYLRKAADKDNPYAAYLLGRIYQNDRRYKNFEIAVKYYSQSAQAGNPYANYQLGKIYFYGADDFNRDIDLALEYLNTAKEQGNPYAKQMLYNIQKHKTHFAATSSIRLIESMAEMLQQRREQDENQKHKYRIDRKEQQKINEKKQAHGLKISM